MQVTGFRAVGAELDSLLHLGDGFGPVLGVGCFDGEIAKLADLVGDLLLFLQVVEALLILLGRGIVGLTEGAGEIVKGLRMIGIGP